MNIEHPLSIAQIPAIILAGGLGTRLRSVVTDRPKVLAPVNDRPFLAYLLDQLEQAGLQKVILCTGYLASYIQQEFGSVYGNLSLAYSIESESLGTAGAIRLALSQVDNDLCLVMNGDSYADANLHEFLFWHQQYQFAGSLLLTWMQNTARFGTVQVDCEGVIQAFYEKQGQVVPGWINAGIYLLSRSLVETLPLNQNLSIERQGFPNWIQFRLGGFCTQSAFIDIGTPESFVQAELFFANMKA